MGDLNLALQRMRPIEGWFPEFQASTLFAFAEKTEGIVEIGSYCGRSTVVLATAGPVWAIDPLEGDAGLVEGWPAESRSRWQCFVDNIFAAGVQDNVRLLRARSLDVCVEFPIGLLFIDGLHDYESVKADFEHFEPMVREEGVIAFHDYGEPVPEWGVTRLVDELLDIGQWRSVAHAGSLVIVARNRS